MIRLRTQTVFPILALIAAIMLAVGLSAQSAPSISDPLSAQATSRIVQAVQSGRTQVLLGNRHPLARVEFESGMVPAKLQLQQMVLVLKPSAAQQAALETLLEAQRTPSSPYFHHWLTPGEFAEHYGASEMDVQQIVSWLQGHGLHAGQVTASRRAIEFSGTAEQVERAFGTSMRQYRVDGALHVANASDPVIPGALAPVVAGVLSLNDFRPAAMNSGIRNPAVEYTFGGTHFVTPADLAAIYDVNPLYTQGVDGSGQSVAVVGRSNVKLSDLRAFRSTYGLPVNDPQVIVNGIDPGTANFNELLEATLDAEYAGALARMASVKFVATASTATTDGVFLSAQYIVNQNLAPVMTMSFGMCEAQLGAAANTFISGLWQQAAAQGITVVVASGDSGAAGCDAPTSTYAHNGQGVNGLCSTPYDLCIGGTEFNDAGNPAQYWSGSNTAGTYGSALSYVPEVVWNESGGSLWASGGGRSQVYAKPSWQTGPGVSLDRSRDVPDVSLTAASHDGYMVVVGGQQYAVGGTSASAPALASMLGLVVQSTGSRLGLANPRLYSLAAQQGSGGAAVFHDILKGSNGVPLLVGYAAGSGFDMATGLGSVDASMMVSHWLDGQSGPALQLTMDRSALAVMAGMTGTIAVQVGGTGGLNSAVALTASGLPAGVSATFSVPSIAAPGTGSSSLLLTVDGSVIPGVYGFNVNAHGGAVSASSPATLTVTAAGIELMSSQDKISVTPGNKASTVFTTVGSSALIAGVTFHHAGIPAGVTASFSPASIAAPGSGSTTMTLTCGSTAVTGSYVMLVTAAAGSVTKSAQVLLNIPSLTAKGGVTATSITRGATAAVGVSTQVGGGFSAPVTITVTGLPSGVTAAATGPIAAPGAGTAVITLSASSTATLGNARITITTSGGGLTAAVPILLTTRAATAGRIGGPGETAWQKIDGD